MMKKAKVSLVESLDVYADGRKVLWHRCQYLMWRALSSLGSSVSGLLMMAIVRPLSVEMVETDED